MTDRALKNVGRGSVSALNLQGSLADAVTEVMELGAADLAAVDHFDLGDAGGVKGEHTLDTLTVRYLADSEGSVDFGATAGNDQAFENLNTLLAAFDNTAMHLDPVTDVEIHVLLKLFLFDFINDVHELILLLKGVMG